MSPFRPPEIKEKVEEVAEKYNVVVLVPSFSRAKFWDKEGTRTAKKDNINRIVDELKSGKHVGKVIFVNRYDGIDLPGDACRMLVIDGLPPLNSIKDRYIQSVAPQSTILLREQVQRIEQGNVIKISISCSDMMTVMPFSFAMRRRIASSSSLWRISRKEVGSSRMMTSGS